MDELIKTFHIDWKLLVAQIVNFGIVVGVLWFFALKPLLKVMQKRSADIEKSLKDAKEIEQKMKDTDLEKEKIIKKARQEYQVLLEEASHKADALRQEKLQETKNEVEKIIIKTKTEIAAEKEKMVEDAKKEVGKLVIQAAAKLIEKNMDENTDNNLIDNTVKGIK